MTEVLWNKLTAEAATLGQSKSFWEVTGISFDSRKINKGDLFIALPGKRDCHDFVTKSMKFFEIHVFFAKNDTFVENLQMLIAFQRRRVRRRASAHLKEREESF